MPGTEKLARCPKGERRDKKTKKCVKVGKAKTPSPKRNTVKAPSPKKNSVKAPSPKKNSVKALSPKISPPKTIRKSPSPKKPSPVSANIPYISTMNDLSSYVKGYMKQLLVRLSNKLDGKSFDKGGHLYIYANLNGLIDILKKEIHSISTQKKSGKYVFMNNDVNVVIPQLERLVKYFKHIANAKGHVDVDTIAELYDN